MPKGYYADARRLSRLRQHRNLCYRLDTISSASDVSDLLEQLSAMPGRVIDISNRGAPASWRASWNGALWLITSSARAAHHVEHAQPYLPQQVIKRFKRTPEEAHGPS
jgi:hypothetical protein